MPQAEQNWAKPAMGGIFLLLALITGYILWPYFFKATVPDESTFVYEGYRVYKGDLPYRDFFDFILPGTYYVVAAVYKLFGVSLFWLRMVALATITGCITLTLLIARSYLPVRWVFALGLLLWLVNIPGAVEIQHHLFSAFFGMLSVFCLWKALWKTGEQATKWTWTGGFFIGATMLFTQSLGIFLGLAMLIFEILYFWQGQKKPLAKAFLKSLLEVVLPAVLPITIVFLYFASQNAWQDLWHSTFQWVAGGGYAHTTSHWFLLDGAVRLASYSKVLFRSAEMTWFALSTLTAGWLPVLGLLWAGEYAVRRLAPAKWHLSVLTEKDWRLALLLAASLAFFAASFSYPNTRLVSTHGWIPYLLAMIGLYQVAHPSAMARKVLGGFLVLVFAFAAYVEAGKSAEMLAGPRIVSYGTVEKTLLGGGSADAAYAYNQMIEFIRQATPPGKTLFTYNHAPELYLYADRHNPTRYQLIMALLDTPDQINEVAASLAKAKPGVIVYNQVDAINFRYDMRFRDFRQFDYHLYPIEKILADSYMLVAQMGNTLIFQRKP